MKKKYKCRLSASSLLVNVKGQVRRLEFEPSVLSEFGLRGCAYTTDNEALQYAIEHSARYRNHRMDEVWTDDVDIKVNVEKEVAPVQAFSAPEVTVPVVEEEKPKRVKRIKKEA